LADKRAAVVDLQQRLGQATAAHYLGDKAASKRVGALGAELTAAQGEANALERALPLVECRVFADELDAVHERIAQNRAEMQEIESERQAAHAEWLVALDAAQAAERAHSILLGRIESLREDNRFLVERAREIEQKLSPPRASSDDGGRVVSAVGAQPGRGAAGKLG
jgi:predicted  nucleic acid-binding Zn-ribbon protein